MATTDTMGIDTLNRFQRRIARQTFSVFVVLGLILLLVGYKPIAKGLVLGALFSVFNFILMARALPHQVGFEHRRATVFASFSIFLRLGLLAVPLIIAMKWDAFHWVAVAVGLFAIPVGIFLDQWIGQRFLPEKID
jgi:uncharacterized membrane protein